MKRVMLGKVKPVGGEEMKVGHIIVNLIKTPPQGKGFDLAEVRERLKIMDKIEAAIDAFCVDLEDAEHALLKRAFSEATFIGVDRILIDVADRVMDAKDTPPALPPAKND